MFQGADPGNGWKLNDPIFGKVPTLGACMPNVRRAVAIGDHIFSISGRVKNVQQYIVGGFSVREKINALAAYERLPENRMKKDEDGNLLGNIIADSEGNHLEIDYHDNFEQRIKNYIIGEKPIYFDTEKEIIQARNQTLEVLRDVFDKKGETVYEILGRWRKLNEKQIVKIVDWMDQIKQN